MNVVDHITLDGVTKYIKDAAGQVMIAPEEASTTATSAHAQGTIFRLDGVLYQATAAIAIGDTITVGTNCEVVNVADAFVRDVQVNGTSIISGGVANVPVANTSAPGVVAVSNDLGIGITDSTNKLYINKAGSSYIKPGTDQYRVIVPYNQHESTFYGLAKAAGDTTQSASSNAVGTYTTSAKNAIHTMLGTADLIEVGFVENVSGSAVTITGQANYRYNCTESSVTTLSITPPSAGSIDVIFTSGSTATVLTIPNTVKFPVWFDATALETNTIYEILITDGVYGSVMSWATT